MGRSGIFQVKLAAPGLVVLILMAIAGGTVAQLHTQASGSSVTLTAMGAYTGAGNASGVTSFASATDSNVSIASDYLDGSDGWSSMDSYQSWLYAPWKGAGYQMVLGVPIIPTSGGTAVGTLAAGAAGNYNSYFVTLAQTLVSAGFGDAILRPGWEFNVPGYTWSVSNPTDAANYAAFYQNIVNSMRTVAGQAFKFVWDGPMGSSGGSWTALQAWPGTSYVDYIGNDTYDQTWNSSCGLAFNNTSTTTQAQCVWANSTLPNLNTVESFAQSVGKPVVFPEWGLSIRPDGHGLGDDPVYIDDMGAWMANAANDVAWASYFDYDQGGGYASEITDGKFPSSLVAYRSEFAPDAASSASTAPPTTGATATSTVATTSTTSTTAAPSPTSAPPTTTGEGASSLTTGASTTAAPSAPRATVLNATTTTQTRTTIAHTHHRVVTPPSWVFPVPTTAVTAKPSTTPTYPLIWPYLGS